MLLGGPGPRRGDPGSTGGAVARIRGADGGSLDSKSRGGWFDPAADARERGDPTEGSNPQSQSSDGPEQLRSLNLCTPRGTRTPDSRVRSSPLYPTELLAQVPALGGQQALDSAAAPAEFRGVNVTNWHMHARTELA